MENLEPHPPQKKKITPSQIKDGKIARFCPSRGFLDLGGGDGVVSFYFVQDCRRMGAGVLFIFPLMELKFIFA